MPTRPLADRMRPRRLQDVAGQAHLLAPGKPLYRAIESGKLHSMVFFGPPGTGKTTLAKLIATEGDAVFEELSAVLCGVKEVREAVARAEQRQATSGQRTVLFVDEVHRFNKAQQDAFLPHIEKGTIVFVGATTENPSFSLNNALLSRLRVYPLRPLNKPAIVQILQQVLSDAENGLAESGIEFDQQALDLLAVAVDGDARRALNMLEISTDLAESGVVDLALIEQVLAGGSQRRFDNQGDLFFDQISALHKSVRGSNPDAALYWLCRMLDGGCDPKYLARRLIRMASEDIGNADPRALSLCLDAAHAMDRLGSPEGELALAQATLYLAVAAKSNAAYIAFKQAMQTVKEQPSLEVPMHLRNAPTKLMKEQGNGQAYRYAHDEEHGYAAGERYLPAELGETDWYQPVARGMEIKIREKLAFLRQLDANYKKSS